MQKYTAESRTNWKSSYLCQTNRMDKYDIEKSMCVLYAVAPAHPIHIFRSHSFHALFIYLLKWLFIRKICKLRFVWLPINTFAHRHTRVQFVIISIKSTRTRTQKEKERKKRKLFPFSFCIAETHTDRHTMNAHGFVCTSSSFFKVSST